MEKKLWPSAFLGLSEAMKIADLAYTLGIRDYPHIFLSAISVAANVHLATSMPVDTLIEYRTSLSDLSMEELLTEPFKVEKGYVEVPKGSGLGIEQKGSGKDNIEDLNLTLS